MADVHVLEPGEDPTRIPLSQRRARKRGVPGGLWLLLLLCAAFIAAGAWGFFGRRKAVAAATPVAAIEPTSTATPTLPFENSFNTEVDTPSPPAPLSEMPSPTATNRFALTVTALWFGPQATATATLIGPLDGATGAGYPVATGTPRPPPSVIQVVVTRVVVVTQIVPAVTVVYVVVTPTGAPASATPSPTATLTNTPTPTNVQLNCAPCDYVFLSLVIR